jgi:hypothetical protein
VIFLLAGAIYRLPHRDFSFGQCNPSITVLHFSFGQRDTPIAALRFFFLPARDPLIAVPQFFLLARVTRRLPRRNFFSWPA